jgi:general secretion pathway protein G
MKKLLQGLLVASLSFTVSWLLVERLSRPYIQQYFRETVLRQELRTMRKAIDQYASDQSKLPQSLNDLLRQGYIREIPADPMTNQPNWEVEFGEHAEMVNGQYGVVDVHSSCTGESADGSAFRDF